MEPMRYEQVDCGETTGVIAMEGQDTGPKHVPGPKETAYGRNQF